MVGCWLAYTSREYFCQGFPTSNAWKKFYYQISGSLLSILFLLEVAVFFDNYFILLAIKNEMQSLSTGGNEVVNSIVTIGSSTPTPPG